MYAVADVVIEVDIAVKLHRHAKSKRMNHYSVISRVSKTACK